MMAPSISNKKRRSRRPGLGLFKNRTPIDVTTVLYGHDLMMLATTSNVAFYNNDFSDVDSNILYSIRSFRQNHPHIALVEFPLSFIDNIRNDSGVVWRNPALYSTGVASPCHEAGNFTVYSVGVELDTIADYLHSIHELGIRFTER